MALSIKHILLLVVGNGASLVISAPPPLGPPSDFLLTPRDSELDWNIPRPDTVGFLALRPDVHSAEYFNNPPTVAARSLYDDAASVGDGEAIAFSKRQDSDESGSSAGWDTLNAGSPMASDPAPVSNADQQLDLFHKNSDNALMHRSRNGSAWTSAWDNLGGSLDSAPSTTSMTSGHVSAFVKGTDNQCWHKSSFQAGFEASWSSSTWQSLGGNMVGQPSCNSWGPDRMDLYAASGDGQAYHRSYQSSFSSWSSWESIGGYLASAPRSVSWGAGHQSVFVQGTDGQCWHRMFSASAWASWESLGGSVDGIPAAVAFSNQLHVFVKGTDGGCWHKSFSGGAWGTWENLGGNLKYAPEVIRVAGRLEVYITSTDNGVYRRVFSAGSWSATWVSLGGSLNSKPKPITWYSGSVEVYAWGSDNNCKKCIVPNKW